MTHISKPVTGALMALASLSAAAFDGLNIVREGTTVSGLSSGGYMATQMHYAHSDWITGAGMIASGPYYCGQNDIKTALSRCVNKQTDEIPLSIINKQLSLWEASGKIAPTQNLKDDKVWILHGTLDTRVIRPVTNKLVEQYSQYVNPTQLEYVDEQPVAHHFPTMSSGTNCDISEAPFIGKCDYDAAGEMLSHLYSELATPSQSQSGELREIDQSLVGEFGDTLGAKGFVYVPQGCAQGQACRLHISFHGCNQNVEAVGNQYVANNGINRWADANDLIVLYPQTRASMLMPLNPQGCWDWWGYTGDNYANRHGKQMQAVVTLVDIISQDH